MCFLFLLLCFYTHMYKIVGRYVLALRIKRTTSFSPSAPQIVTPHY